MYPMLQHAHSGLRWLLLVFLVLSVVRLFTAFQEGRKVQESDRKSVLLALIFTHSQILIGLILYFVSPKVLPFAEAMADKSTRFFAVEHMTGMIIAAVLITIGYTKIKNGIGTVKPFKSAFWYFLAGLLLILLMIPWPFQNYGAGWF